MTIDEKRSRIGFLLVIVGLLVQAATAFLWSPGTFVVAVSVGVPLVLVGAVVVAISVVRARGEGGDGGKKQS